MLKKEALSQFSPSDSTSLNEFLSLRDRKRIKWAKEKAENTEWFPFGKPGSGAPLRPNNLNGSNKSTPSITPESSFGRNNEKNCIINNQNITEHQKQSQILPSSYEMINQYQQQPTYGNFAVHGGGAGDTPPQGHNAIAPASTSFDAAVYSPSFLAYLNYLSRNGYGHGHGRSPPTVSHGQIPVNIVPQVLHQSEPNYSHLYAAYAPYHLKPSTSVSSISTSTTPYVLSYPEFLSAQYGQYRTPLVNVETMQNKYTPSPQQFGQHPLALLSSGVQPDLTNSLKPNFTSSPIHGNRLRGHPVNLHSTAFVSPENPMQNSSNGGSTSNDFYNLLPYHQNVPVDSPMQNLKNSNDNIEPTHYHNIAEYDVHRRRNAITEPRNELDFEEKCYRIHETKNAIDEQIAEKRRLKLLELEEERKERERLKRERAILDSKEKRENQKELNRWKELMLDEQRREKAVLESWEKAKAEAKESKRHRLLQHAMQIDEENNNSNSNNNNSSTNNGAEYTNFSREHSPFDMRTLNASKSPKILNSYSSYDLSTDRSRNEATYKRSSSANGNFDRSIPVVSPKFKSHLHSPDDERPIRPLTKDPLKIWDSMIVKGPPSIYSSHLDKQRLSISERPSDDDDHHHHQFSKATTTVERPERIVKGTIDKPNSFDLKPVREVERKSRSVAKRFDKSQGFSNNLLKPNSSSLNDTRELSAASTYVVVKNPQRNVSPDKFVQDTNLEKNKRLRVETNREHLNDKSTADEHNGRHPSLTNVTARRGQKLMSRPKETNLTTLASSDYETVNEYDYKTEDVLFDINETKTWHSPSTSKKHPAFPVIANGELKFYHGGVDYDDDSDENDNISIENNKKKAQLADDAAKEAFLEKLSHLNLDSEHLSFLKENRPTEPKIIFLKNSNPFMKQKEQQIDDDASSEIIERQIRKIRELLKQNQQAVADSLMVHEHSASSKHVD